MACNIYSDHGELPQIVHFNVISGELLVEGRPLGKLPLAIVEHAEYKRLFGPVRLSYSIYTPLTLNSAT